MSINRADSDSIAASACNPWSRYYEHCAYSSACSAASYSGKITSSGLRFKISLCHPRVPFPRCFWPWEIETAYLTRNKSFSSSSLSMVCTEKILICISQFGIARQCQPGWGRGCSGPDSHIKWLHEQSCSAWIYLGRFLWYTFLMKIIQRKPVWKEGMTRGAHDVSSY